jgi:DNA repair protein RecO (recombination protein O)
MASRPDTPVQALVLRTVDYADADRIVTLLTREHGRIACLARGARRSGRRFRGGLSVLQRIDARVRLAEHGLSTQTESDAIHDAQTLGQDLLRWAIGLALVELLAGVLPEGGGGDPWYGQVHRFLDWLESERRGPLWLQAGFFRIQWLLLEEVGAAPDLDGCVRSGQPLAGTSEEAWWLFGDGIVLASCRRHGESGLRLAPKDLAWLRSLAAGHFGQPTAAHCAALRNLFRPLWEAMLGTSLRAWAFFETRIPT